jgi:hypothetical protein
MLNPLYRRCILKPALDIVFVTYGDLKQGDPDDLDALEILRKRGYQLLVC